MYAGEQVETSPTERPICGLPVDTAALFVDKKGVYKPRIEKNRMKLLAKLGFLSKFLDADEKILLVATGCSPFTALEQATMGAAWLIAVKRALFVFTNKRLFHIPATNKHEYRGSIAQILYQDCKRLHVKGSALVAEYHNGKKEKFLYIPRADRAIIKRFNLQADASDQPSAQPQRNHLCPNCTQLLPKGVTACPACGLEFKNRATALRYSVLLPGGGYFYTRHPYMGVADAVAETYLTLATLIALAAGLLGDPEAMTAFVGIGLVLVLEKLATVYHSNAFLAEFIPANLKALLSSRPVPEAPTELPSPPPIPEKKQRVEDVLSVR
jgi:hypothetical protein